MQNLLNLLLNKNLITPFVILLMFCSCEKDVELIDSELNPGEELIIQNSEESSFFTTTVRENPLEGLRQNTVPFGKISEQRFGEVKASFYTNFRLTVTGFNPDGPITLDSAFINLKYDNTYGSLQENIDVEIYELVEKIDPNQNLTNNEILSTNSTLIASKSNISIQSGEEGVLKIPVNQTFAQSFIDQFGTSIFADNEAFEDFFNGIYVTVGEDSGEDGLLYLRLNDEETNFSIHFDAPQDSIYSFEITNQAAWLTQYNQNYTGSDVETLLNTQNENQDLIYISAYSGTKGNIELPDLTSIKNAIINKAEITFYQTDFGSSLAAQFTVPQNLFLFLNNTDSTLSSLPGVDINNLEDFGGERTLGEINGFQTSQYKFNITPYVQDIVNGSDISQSLSLSVLNVNTGNRVIVGGANHPNFSPRLKILYTLAE